MLVAGDNRKVNAIVHWPINRTLSRDALLRTATLIYPALALIGLTPATAAPVISFEAPSNIHVSQLTSGGQAIVMAVAKTRSDWDDLLTFHLTRMNDGDRDGLASYTEDAAFSPRSVWAAVDMANGSLDVSAPTQPAPRSADVNLAQMLATAGKLEDQRQGLRLLVVRPGKGAWHGAAYDGGAGDTGAADDNRVLVDLGMLASVSGASGLAGSRLSNLMPGDVVVGIDTVTLAYYTFTVPGVTR